ncbi:MAG: hypothetical protein K2H23_00840, partial [Oscillospiraceae bacterium]|nr:hypothetical protein [Oscillospiraceae bacterium]
NGFQPSRPKGFQPSGLLTSWAQLDQPLLSYSFCNCEFFDKLNLPLFCPNNGRVRYAVFYPPP